MEMTGGKRWMDAVNAGADYLVIGRPITRADDPRAAAEMIGEEIAAASA
jgi:orotidine-5'-phosphate decarboxylase